MVKTEAIDERPYTMDAVCESFAGKTTPNTAPYTTRSCFALLRHNARDRHWMTSNNRALGITRCDTIETTLHARRLLWAGTPIPISGGRYQSESLLKYLVQCGEDGVGRRKASGSIAYRAPVWRSEGLESGGVRGRGVD